MTKHPELKRRVRERMAKTGESYTAARAQLLAERPTGGTGGALHLTNGDSTVPGLLATGLAETVIPWRDVLHEGPVPDVDDAELRRIRAGFLEERLAADIGTLAEFERRDRTLAAHRGGAYVLWFEADLYDQLQVVQILAMLHDLGVAAGRITLICIGEHVGSAHFGGLGELGAEQLARLPETAATVLTPAAVAHGARAWAALRAPDPADLRAVAATPSAELRFVSEAFDRLGREYPSTRDGLSLTERRILAAVADGAGDAGTAFVRGAVREARPFLGDTWAFDRMHALATCSDPLLTISAEGRVTRHTRLSLTPKGRQVLDGQADHVELNGVDRWIGGVHLEGRAVPWRWDEGTEAVVPASGT